MVSNMIRALFSFSLNYRTRSSLVRVRGNFAMVQSPLFPLPILTRSYSSRVRHLLYPVERLPKSSPPSVRLPVDRFVTHNWTAERMFLKSDFRRFYEKLSQQFQFWIKSERYDRHFTWRNVWSSCKNFQVDITLPSTPTWTTKQKLCTDFRLHWQEVSFVVSYNNNNNNNNNNIPGF